MDGPIFVSVDLDGAPQSVGRLWTRAVRGRESASFEYDPSWLSNPLRFALEPALTLGKGAHHTVAGRPLFGAFGDSAPDRWGRVLIQRDERRRAREENRAPRTLLESDYLLGGGDLARQGALRLATEPGGVFVANGTQIPPLVRLEALLNAAMNIADDGGSDADLRLLLAPGSSLGGARPKASVIDRDGHLAIAKFPKRDDPSPVTVWEAVALQLACDAGLQVTPWRLETIGEHPVLVVPRFDRDGARRIPFLSAMSMLGAADNEPHSYMEIADALRRYGAQPQTDLTELWRRIVFSILISNTDDHLRNHGLLYDSAGGGWRLAPAYDLNPTPVELKARILSLAIDEGDATASLDVAFSVAGHFGLKRPAALAIVAEVGRAVANWRRVASGFGLSSGQLEAMASAFEHEELAQATALVRT